MKSIRIIFRSFFRKGNNNLIKILSLGLGLAMGLVLFAKVYFEQSYDNFFPDGERVYQIQTNFAQGTDDFDDFGQVSGGVAPGMKTEIPEVETATRFTYLMEGTFFTPDKKKYNGTFILGDTCLFDIFPLPILAGHAKEVLSRPMYALVSQKIANKMGGTGRAVGQVIELDPYPGKRLTIGGVFDDIPENSHLGFDVVVSLPSISQFMRDGTMNWIGNDRYMGYVKLIPGTKPESLAASFRKMQEKHQQLEELSKAGYDIRYTLSPVHQLHSGTPEVKRMNLLLSLLAFALLFTAIMNYILVVISSLVRRAKEVAVNKCYGASGKDIQAQMLTETLIQMIFSLALAALLIVLFQGVIRDIVGTSIKALFNWQSSILLFAICVIVYLVTSFIPGAIFARIPVASAFRGFNENRRNWKLGLLFIQFIAAGFLFCLLAVIGQQYNHMVNDDPGYSYEELAYCNISGTDSLARQTALSELARLPEVASVTTCSQLLFYGAAGNNISLPGDVRELFNAADLYSVGNDYLSMMEIPVIAGRSFHENVPVSHEVMVSRSFVDRISLMVDWKDGVIGKEIFISQHSKELNSSFTICGVYEDFRLGTMHHQDTRPSILFYSSKPSECIVIKFHKLSGETMQQASATLQSIMPNKDVVVYSYQSEMTNLYKSSRQFRDAVMISGIVTLIISLIGLIGYTNDEMNRRKKETAIRKVNGATIWDILKLFQKNILQVALPALILGGGIAAYVASKWQESFSEKIPLSPSLFIFCGSMVLLIILTVVSVNCYRAAIQNPAQSVKSE